MILKKTMVATAVGVTLACSSLVSAATKEELEQKLEALEAQMEELRSLLKDTDSKAEAAIAAAEDTSSAGASWADRTSIGGYGELHYNNLSAEDPARDLERVDFHRFVLFFGHEFNDRIRLFSEFELEHALTVDTADGTGPGEVELEQAYVEIDLTDNILSRTGVFLIPVGILNETHEPPTFYGVERNDVENIIIPSTWWEAGLGFAGNTEAGLSWDIALHSGLEIPTAGANAFRVRSGRQKVANATASDLAITGRLKYTGIPGLELGLTGQYQGDPSQVDGDGLDDGTLLAAHFIGNWGNFGLRALYGRWDFSGDAVEAAGVDTQEGWYIEPSYKISEKVGVYFRYEDLEGARTSDRFDQYEIGLNYWPTPNVVFKVDYRDRNHDLAADEGRDFTGFDLGVGYQF